MSDVEKRIEQMLIMQRKNRRHPHRPNGLKIQSTCINNKNVSKHRNNLRLMNSDPIDGRMVVYTMKYYNKNYEKE